MNLSKESLRIIYMGTPDFAVESLKALVEGGYNVVGVITMPDKAVGRHQSTTQPSPVKQYAVDHDIKVLQPDNLKSEDFLQELKSLNADLQIVVAFRMLPEVVWAMPPLGTFNLHASLLPQYRGAAPINWAIINGDTKTGITTFFLQHAIDTGHIIDQTTVDITLEDNAGTLHDKLMLAGAKLVIKTVDEIIAGTVNLTPQSQLSAAEALRPAPKIFKDTCAIDWSMGLKRCYDFIRGLSPYPAAWTTLLDGDKTSNLKIYATAMENATHHHPIGALLSDGKTYLKVAVEGGYLQLQELQLAGKKRMSIADFLRGFKYNKNLRVE